MPVADAAVFDTCSYSEMEERQAHKMTLYPIINYIKPVELNPASEQERFLRQLSKIPCNWDGYEAIPPSKQVVNNAINFLENLPESYKKILNLDEINITPYGTIVMEWYNSYNNFLSIEIGKTKLGFISNTPDGTNPFLESTEFNPNEIDEKIFEIFIKIFSV